MALAEEGVLRGSQREAVQPLEPNAAPSVADLRELYFGPPIIPPKHIIRAEEAPAKAAPAPRPLTVTKQVATRAPARHQTGRKLAVRPATKLAFAPAPRAAAAPARRATTKRAAVALYKEAVPTQADAFSDERSVRWRKCIPGVQMPLVCYLPAEDRSRITVYPAE
jgi:hypothetical protein